MCSFRLPDFRGWRRGIQFRLDLLNQLIDTGECLRMNLGIADRSIHVHLHKLLARAVHQILHKGYRGIVATYDPMEQQFQFLIEVHRSLAMQAAEQGVSLNRLASAKLAS